MSGSMFAPLPSLEEVREARVAAARANKRWTEIPEARLERRPFGLLADAKTGETYARRTGATFEAGRIAFDELVPLYFFVDAGGNVVMLERRRS